MVITAHLSPSAYGPAWFELSASEPDREHAAIHFHASSERDALVYAGNVLAARWPDKHDDITLHVQTREELDD